MKTRFTTLDICAVMTEINSKLVGMRLANVYDINNKTYLLKLAKPDHKAMLLIESGIRIHISEFDWPKNMMPSGFSMKLRKHLRGRRFVSASQLGIDRVVDIQFGSEEAAYHVILELYDRGNIVLTDHQYTVLNLLRFRKDKRSKETSVEQTEAAKEEDSDVRFGVHDKYPLHSVKRKQDFSETRLKLEEVIKTAKAEHLLKRVLNPHLPFGAPCIEHSLLTAGYSRDEKVGQKFNDESNLNHLLSSLEKGERLLDLTKTEKNQKGYIIQKIEKKSDGTTINTNMEFHPFLFAQHEDLPHVSFDSFNKAVDEFFGQLESQRADMKILQQEKSAYKKLDNIKKDHEQRLANLEKEQDTDVFKARLIELNLPLVGQAIRLVRTAIANQIDWNEIDGLIKEAKDNGDLIAQSISRLKLQSNEITMALNEPNNEFESDEDFFSDDEEKQHGKAKMKPKKPVKVDIDLGLSAYANAKKYYDRKRQAAHKQQKTIDASEKALKSAEKKTTQALKEAATIHNIQKARKTFWFEKFLWFISSENYLVIGGRDAQQNEILVKKYLTAGDIYVHADLHGATSCIIKNTSKSEIPPKTLNEAGTMAICHSAAWDAKVVTSAWWVHHHQVSKTAPSGEYLTTGSFLIRGKKNYLPPSYLVYGFGILFKVDETCVHKHKDERRVMPVEDQESSASESLGSIAESELKIADSGSDSGSEDENQTEGGSTSTTDIKVGDMIRQTDRDETPDDQKTDNILEFPDTNIQLRYERSAPNDNEALENDDDYTVYLGDNEPITYKVAKDGQKLHLSAKQRRDLKKGKSQAPLERDDATNEVISDAEQNTDQLEEDSDSKSGVTQVAQAQPKRGQKNKLKKLKVKYKHQDEEERLMKMELLQQSQSQKARDRKAKKNKANNKKENSPNETVTKNKRVNQHKANNAKLTSSNSTSIASKNDGYDSDEERSKILQNEHLTEKSISILNSLTGCPLPDDVLMFAIPVCAPYNTMHNYKFKVKLTPGNTKKGKGAKTALSVFQNLRETNALEKDHLRSIKDHDLARNMPGKVKVSAPNLHRKKK